MGYKRTIYKIWLWASRKGGTWIYLTQTGTSERSDYGSSNEKHMVIDATLLQNRPV